jgi:hypothetical protein
VSRTNIVEIQVPYHLIFTFDISGYLLCLLSHSQSMKSISARSEQICFTRCPSFQFCEGLEMPNNQDNHSQLVPTHSISTVWHIVQVRARTPRALCRWFQGFRPQNPDNDATGPYTFQLWLPSFKSICSSVHAFFSPQVLLGRRNSQSFMMILEMFWLVFHRFSEFVRRPLNLERHFCRHCP